jgi:hypothetical protein
VSQESNTSQDELLKAKGKTFFIERSIPYRAVKSFHLGFIKQSTCHKGQESLFVLRQMQNTQIQCGGKAYNF